MSAELSEGKGEVLPSPPATRTRPSDSSTALCHSLPAVMLPVDDHVPVVGSYSAAELNTPPHRFPPPAKRTFPSLRVVMVCPVVAKGMVPVKLQVPVTGSYSSEEVSLAQMLAFTPPATR